MLNIVIMVFYMIKKQIRIYLLLGCLCLLNSCLDNSETIPIIGVGGQAVPTTEVRDQNAWYQIARNYSKTQDYEKSLSILDSAIQTTKDSLYLAHAYYLQGYIYNKQKKQLSSLESYYHAVEVYEKLDQSKFLSNVLYNIGGIYEKSNLLEKAKDNYLKIYNLIEDDPDMTMRVLNNIGLAYKNLENYNQALFYYEKGLFLSIKSNNEKIKYVFMDNICVAYRHIKDYVKAEKYGWEALAIQKQLGNEKSKALTLNNLALVYKEANQREKAKDLFLQSIKIHKKYGHPYLASSYNNLAELYIEEQDFEKANYYLDKALLLENAKLDDRSYTLKLKADIAQQQGDTGRLANYQALNLALKDSIIRHQNMINDIDKKNQLLVNQVENKVYMSRLEHEKALQEAESAHQKKKTFWTIVLAISIGLALVIFVIQYLRSRRRNVALGGYTMNMTHTMRNQMSAISGNVYLSERYLDKLSNAQPNEIEEKVGEIRGFLGAIRNTFTDMNNLATKVLTAQHDKKVQVVTDMYDPTYSINTSMEVYTPVAMKKRIHLKTEILSEPMALTDPEVYDRVLDNLVNNAIKYSPEDSTITIKLYEEENQVLLSVMDEGPGIRKRDQNRLFQKGVKLHSRKDVVSSGMGLYHAKKDVEKTGGELRYKDRKGGGSIFTVAYDRAL